MYNHLLRFLNNQNILSDNRYGFRKHHSTASAYALTCLFDKISSAIDNKECTVGIFIDLSKAFDTVDHNILISKLEHYGVRGTSLGGFERYLSNRQQYVEFNGVSSESCEIKCGVPQGSILGPLLFLLYINDLCNVSKVVDFILFADDTNIFFSHKDFYLPPGIFNSEMLKLTQWCRANKLSINFKKSNFMVYGIICKVSFDAHTGVLFKEQEILKFSDIYLYQIGKFMYLFKRSLLPNYFRDMFTLASQIHSYNTRNSNLFYK